MGFKRVFFTGCAGMLCLIPMAWISFRFLNLTEGVTGGLIVNIDDAIGAISGFFGAAGFVIEILIGMVIGVALIFLFPIHWILYYRPDDVGLLIAVTIPWILACVITSGLFAHSPRGGFNTSLAMGIGYAIILTVVYFVLSAILPLGSAILDGVLLGLTDLPFLFAVLTAIFEGCLVGAIFGAFIGSLKYKPEAGKEKKKIAEAREEHVEVPEIFPSQTLQNESTSTTSSDFCTECGAVLTAEELFCTNCGAKKSE
ncbi:hypothetical protein LCGC14_0599860 [marine sediment metagenome]|uniref:Zinc-ribbon domain-containing protein n=1 Tax=marine sediment metagenome TaxID=412755 RepID=A0A0F9UJ92_9ZZZZ|nr:zinc ribbon domain-containing protein [archaeon]